MHYYRRTYIVAYILGFIKNTFQSYLVLKLHQIILIEVSRISFLKQHILQLLLQEIYKQFFTDFFKERRKCLSLSLNLTKYFDHVLETNSE